MRIRISAEPPEPKIVEFNKEDAWLVEFDDSKLSQNTWDEFKAWHNKYAPYTDINRKTVYGWLPTTKCPMYIG